VTGGAGYIGSVAVKRLCDEGYSVVVFDNLSKGKNELVDKRAEFCFCDLNDFNVLQENFLQYSPFDAVIHFAAAKDAGESMHNLTPYTQNITCLNNLLICMDLHGCKKIIFSSSAAVYGNPVSEIMDENHPLEPESYYGFSKLECERIPSWYSKLKDLVINLVTSSVSD